MRATRHVSDGSGQLSVSSAIQRFSESALKGGRPDGRTTVKRSASGERLLADKVPDEATLAKLCGSLGATSVPGLSDSEASLLQQGDSPGRAVAVGACRAIQAGRDPLGEAFCALRSAAERRSAGAVYTPHSIVDAMIAWARALGAPERVVDPGAGSARFLVRAGIQFPDAQLVAIENDPLAALTARATLAARGMASRSEVRVENFLTTELPAIDGRTLFVGNPPYVRHHLIPPEWKRWLKAEAKALGARASALAGLHAYFFLAIAKLARHGDSGALITSAEWLDVNYGKLVRDLFVGKLGGQSVLVVEPQAEPFPGTATTGAITTFRVGESPRAARFGTASGISPDQDLASGPKIRRERLVRESRWSDFTRTLEKTPEGFVELGELCRVHRGQVTGANKVWIEGPHSAGLPPQVLFPAVTRARELFDCGPALSDGRQLRRVIDLPADLSDLTQQDLEAVRRFLATAERMGAKHSYVARHRRSWWSVGLRSPAPILATYMARRAPAFVLNGASAHHLNVAHGLYPRERLPEPVLIQLVKWLRRCATLHGGRVYAGGLTKFEPREMERIRIPTPLQLMSESE